MDFFKRTLYLSIFYETHSYSLSLIHWLMLLRLDQFDFGCWRDQLTHWYCCWYWFQSWGKCWYLVWCSCLDIYFGKSNQLLLSQWQCLPALSYVLLVLKSCLLRQINRKMKRGCFFVLLWHFHTFAKYAVVIDGLHTPVFRSILLLFQARRWLFDCWVDRY